MEWNEIVQMIEKSIAGALEIFGVLVIGFAFFHAVARAPLRFLRGKEAVYDDLKSYIGKSLQLALEFLVAADIIRTVLIEPTRQGLLLLGLLIILRTFLSWSITVEIEGCWPWQVSRRGVPGKDGP